MSKRVSRPQRGNLKSNSQGQLIDDKIQPNVPPHDPDYDMQYGCSRKTGDRVGGCFWNPPDYCEKRINTYGGERWVLVGLCKQCHRYTSKTCPARSVDTDIYAPDYVADEPATRKPKRVERHVAAQELRQQVRSRRVTVLEEPPRRRRVS